MRGHKDSVATFNGPEHFRRFTLEFSNISEFHTSSCSYICDHRLVCEHKEVKKLVVGSARAWKRRGTDHAAGNEKGRAASDGGSAACWREGDQLTPEQSGYRNYGWEGGRLWQNKSTVCRQEAVAWMLAKLLRRQFRTECAGKELTARQHLATVDQPLIRRGQAHSTLSHRNGRS